MTALARVAFVLVSLALSVAAAFGATKTTDERTIESKPVDEKPGDDKELKDKVSTTKHSLTVAGKRLDYTATAGTLVMKDEEGAAKATIFYIAYSKDGATDPATRPLTFSFNGGPGSSSVWLHLGVLGPKRVLMDDEGLALPPPYRMVDNEHALLDVTDLVFIDPVTTGYSRPAPKEDAHAFHGVTQDVESVGDFIRLWTTRNKRWASPKFLIGESYGTTRAAGLSGYLQQRHGMYLNGIMLVSSILDFETARFDPGNDLPYILFLPTYAATAWHHGRVSHAQHQDLGVFLKEVETFATGPYALALMQGDALPDEGRDEIATRVASYTGLSKSWVLRADLRIEIQRFCKELLRDEGFTVGRLDSRFKGRDRDSVGEDPEFDPSLSAITGPYTATLNDYVRRDLGFESDLPYEILTGRVQPWSFDDYKNRYLNVAETLRGAMTRNPSLRVFVANGTMDLATPYFATRYTFDHLGLPKELQDHVSMSFYPAGHMMYIQLASLAKLKADLAHFLAIATP